MQITTADLRALADAPEGYVLYDNGTPDVWAGAHVHHSRVIITQEELRDILGPNPSDEDLADYLPELQTELDQRA